jgi:predicted MFS family arabinose efflux permease
LIGLALGGYGLAQGLLQIPFGLVSDRIGRKTVICGGLALFGAGSVIAALAHTIQGVVVGRIIQGCGAVGSSILALVADSTREEVRTRAMAIVGMTIGLSFVVAILIGPAVAARFGLGGVFWFTAMLAAVGIALTLLAVPTPARLIRHRGAEAVPAMVGRVLRDGELLRLDVAIFALHVILTASFLAVPQIIAGAFRLSTAAEWKLYLPVLAGSVVLMLPAIAVAEARGRMKEVFLAAILVLVASLAALALARWQAVTVALALLAFFTAFNIMEAMLPSLITKTAPADAKGTATGVYSSSQFMGIFVGGVAGGAVSGLAGARGVFLFAAAVALIWLAIAATMRRPGHFSGRIVRLENADAAAMRAIVASLEQAPGVVEAVAAPDEQVAYLKVDSALFDAEAVARIVGAHAVAGGPGRQGS